MAGVKLPNKAPQNDKEAIANLKAIEQAINRMAAQLEKVIARLDAHGI